MVNYNPNQDNLKSFQKGCAPGPGRPKGSVPMAIILQRYLDAVVKIDKHPETGLPAEITARERIAMSWIAKAMKGDMTAIDKLVDRLDGKPLQRTEIMGEDGAPININNMNLNKEQIDALIRIQKGD